MKTPQRIADVQLLLEKAAAHAKESDDAESYVLAWVLDYPDAEDSQ